MTSLNSAYSTNLQGDNPSTGFKKRVESYKSSMNDNKEYLLKKREEVGMGGQLIIFIIVLLLSLLMLYLKHRTLWKIYSGYSYHQI